MQMNFLIIPENKAANVFTMRDELFLAFQIFIITNIFMTYEFSLLELNDELMNEEYVLNLSVLVHDKLCDKLNDELWIILHKISHSALWMHNLSFVILSCNLSCTYNDKLIAYLSSINSSFNF